MVAMTDLAEHLALALEQRGHTIDSADLAAAVAQAHTDEASQQADLLIRRIKDGAGTTPDPVQQEKYRGMLAAAENATPSLEDYRTMEAFDSNVFWRLSSGDHQNLLDAAIAEIETLRAGIFHIVTGQPKGPE